MNCELFACSACARHAKHAMAAQDRAEKMSSTYAGVFLSWSQPAPLPFVSLLVFLWLRSNFIRELMQRSHDIIRSGALSDTSNVCVIKQLGFTLNFESFNSHTDTDCVPAWDREIGSSSIDCMQKLFVIVSQRRDKNSVEMDVFTYHSKPSYWNCFFSKQTTDFHFHLYNLMQMIRKTEIYK